MNQELKEANCNKQCELQQKYIELLEKYIKLIDNINTTKLVPNTMRTDKTKPYGIEPMYDI